MKEKCHQSSCIGVKCFALAEQHKLRTFENKVLGKYLYQKSGNCTISHNKGHCDLYRTHKLKFWETKIGCI
jgi:hypothetical protein